MAASTPIPDKPHPRSLRWEDWLVRRIGPRKVRVISPHGYLDVTMGRGAIVSDATGEAAHLVETGAARWTPLPSRSGESRAHVERQAAGLTRVEVYLSPEATDALARHMDRLGSRRAAIEWALMMAPNPAGAGEEPTPRPKAP